MKTVSAYILNKYGYKKLDLPEGSEILGITIDNTNNLILNVLSDDLYGKYSVRRIFNTYLVNSKISPIQEFIGLVTDGELIYYVFEIILTRAEKEIYDEAVRCGDLEVLAEYWTLAESLVSKGFGTLGLRMLDGDGEVYCEGILVGDADSDEGFAPLDGYGRPALGCIDIQYLENGCWRTL